MKKFLKSDIVILATLVLIYIIGQFLFLPSLGWNFETSQFQNSFATDVQNLYLLRITLEVLICLVSVIILLRREEIPLKILAIAPIIVFTSWFYFKYYESYQIRSEEISLIQQHGSVIEGRVAEYFQSEEGSVGRKKTLARLKKMRASEFENTGAIRAMKLALDRSEIPLIEAFIEKGTEWNWTLILKDTIAKSSKPILKFLLDRNVIDPSLHIEDREAIWFTIDEDNWEATKTLYELGFKNPFHDEPGYHLGMYAKDNEKPQLIAGTSSDPFFADLRSALGERIGGEIKRYLQATPELYMIAGDFIHYAATPTSCPHKCLPEQKCADLKYQCFARYTYKGKFDAPKNEEKTYEDIFPLTPWKSQSLKDKSYYTYAPSKDGSKLIVKNTSQGKRDRKFSQIAYRGTVNPQTFSDGSLLVLRRGQVLEKYNSRGKFVRGLNCPLELNDRIITFSVGAQNQIALISERREQGKIKRDFHLLNSYCNKQKNKDPVFDPTIDLGTVSKIASTSKHILLATSLEYLGGEPIPPIAIVDRQGILQPLRTQEIRDAIQKNISPKCEPEDRIHFIRFERVEGSERYIAKLSCGEGGYGLDFDLPLDRWI